MTLIFYDWEFYEDGSTIEPISLGMVSETENEIYLINKDFDWDNCKNQWLHENVKPQLILPDIPYKEIPREQMQRYIARWLSIHGEQAIDREEALRLVGCYADYDHVLLAQQFGTMMDLPSYIPMWTRDLKQWCNDLGDPGLPLQKGGEHNALLDARWNRTVYSWLVQNYEHPAWTPRLQTPKLKPPDLI